LAAERETVRILNLLAMINQRAGRYEQADGDYHQVLVICRQRGDRPGIVSALNNLGINAHLRGDHHAAEQFFLEALSLTRELSYHDLELVCLDNLAGAQVELGKLTQAESALREVLLRVNGGSWFLLTEVYRYLALACLGQQRCDEAVLAAEHALVLARENHMTEHAGRAWRVLGRIAASCHGMIQVSGRTVGAHECYAASLQLFVEISAAGEQARTAREWAGYELVQGDRQEGARLWQEARDLFTRLGLTVEAELMDRQAAARGMDD
jgi:tetratricopeptide (TPR) repeat protein